MPRAPPDTVVQRLSCAAAEALAAPDIKAFLAQIASIPGGMPPEAAERQLAEETTRWRQVVAAAGIRPQ